MKRVLVLTLLIMSFGLLVHAETKRLILKDGSYQVVSKYEIVGDRVRYMSAERYEWEEIPKNLIDWAATKKWEEDLVAGAANRRRQINEAAQREREALEAETPLVSPGIHLPASGGVFLLDVFQNQPQLAELVQIGSDINKGTGKNILRSIVNPVAISTKQTIELQGPRARVQSHVGDPFIFINIDSDQDPANNINTESAKDRFKIVRVEQKKDRRIVGQLKIFIHGKVKQENRFIPTQVEQVQGGPWVKITPAEKLLPGEYALVEMLGKDVNLFVWDFGVDASAPANATAWKPQPVKPNLTGTDASPVLRKPEKP